MYNLHPHHELMKVVEFAFLEHAHGYLNDAIIEMALLQDEELMADVEIFSAI